MSLIFESPSEKGEREGREARQRAEEQARRAERDRLSTAYAKLKDCERAAERVVDSIAPPRDVDTALAEYIAAKAELKAVRAFLATFPEEIAAAYRPPASPSQLKAQAARDRAAEVASGLAREATYIEQHELPALEAKLNEIPTARELGMWAGYDDPRERYFKLIREQSAERRARIAYCRGGHRADA